MLSLVLLDKMCDQAFDAVLVAYFTLDLMCCEARVQITSCMSLTRSRLLGTCLSGDAVHW